MKMNELECYKIYQGLRLYFTRNYDWFKYGPSAKISISSYEKRRDRYTFQKLARKYSKEKFIDLVVANMVYGYTTWAGILVTEPGEENYFQYLKNHESLYYNFENDCRTIVSTAEQLGYSLPKCFTPLDSHSYPIILNLYTQRKIGLESWILLNKTISLDHHTIFEVLNRSLNDPFWKSTYLIATKYEPFIKYDSKKAHGIATKVFGGI